MCTCVYPSVRETAVFVENETMNKSQEDEHYICSMEFQEALTKPYRKTQSFPRLLSNVSITGILKAC